MTRHFQCRDAVQAHMIRSFLLDHDIEAHVLHENAAHLWSGAVAWCVLGVHETDLEFLHGAFSAPREALGDESPREEGDVPEQDSEPPTFGWFFLTGVTFTGVISAWIWSLAILLLAVANAYPKAVVVYDAELLEFRPINFSDIAAVTLYGIAVGLVWAVAIIAARLVRPDEHGRVSITQRCFIFLIFWFTYNPIPAMLWYLSSLFR